MAIRYAEPPAGAEQLATAGLAEVVHSVRMKTPGGAALATSAPERINLTSAHPVHHAGLDALADRRPLAESARTGWRYLVDGGGGPVASTEVAVDAGGNPTVFAQLNDGPYVASTSRALAQVQQAPEVAAGNYEVRLLKVPALYIAALWLKDLDGDHDLVVPLDPAPDYVEAGRTYTEQAFLDALAEPARQRLQFDDTPRT